MVHLFIHTQLRSLKFTNQVQIRSYLFEGKHIFYGNDPDAKRYSTRAHLAELIGILGPPPTDMLKRGIRSHEFFKEDGTRNYRYIPKAFSA